MIDDFGDLLLASSADPAAIASRIKFGSCERERRVGGDLRREGLSAVERGLRRQHVEEAHGGAVIDREMRARENRTRFALASPTWRYSKAQSSVP